jgi:IS4 transposase
MKKGGFGLLRDIARPARRLQAPSTRINYFYFFNYILLLNVGLCYAIVLFFFIYKKNNVYVPQVRFKEKKHLTI